MTTATGQICNNDLLQIEIVENYTGSTERLELRYRPLIIGPDNDLGIKVYQLPMTFPSREMASRAAQELIDFINR